jgi:hypothetical protein
MEIQRRIGAMTTELAENYLELKKKCECVFQGRLPAVTTTSEAPIRCSVGYLPFGGCIIPLAFP